MFLLGLLSCGCGAASRQSGSKEYKVKWDRGIWCWIIAQDRQAGAGRCGAGCPSEAPKADSRKYDCDFPIQMNGMGRPLVPCLDPRTWCAPYTWRAMSKQYIYYNICEALFDFRRLMISLF